MTGMIIENSEIGNWRQETDGPGPSTLDKVTIRYRADLRYAKFQTLDILKVRWPIDPEEVQLEGLTYQTISTGPKYEDNYKLLDWLDGSRFHTQPYYELESYWQRHGEQEWADEAFLQLKKRQVRENPEFRTIFVDLVSYRLGGLWPQAFESLCLWFLAYCLRILFFRQS